MIGRNLVFLALVSFVLASNSYSGDLSSTITKFEKECKDSGSFIQCLKGGNFASKNKKYSEAIRIFSISCKLDRDGDGGESCYRLGQTYSKIGDQKNALEYYTQACKQRNHAEACALQKKLTGNSSKNEWVGIFKTHEGDKIAITENEAPKLRVVINTIGGNGHSCMFSGEGIPESKTVKLIADPIEGWDEKCELNLSREKDVIDIKISDSMAHPCNSMCGARAILNIDRPFKRIKI